MQSYFYFLACDQKQEAAVDPKVHMRRIRFKKKENKDKTLHFCGMPKRVGIKHLPATSLAKNNGLVAFIKCHYQHLKPAVVKRRGKK